MECDLTLNLIERFHHDEFDLILIKANEKNQISEGVNVWNEPVEWVGKKELLPTLNEKAIIPLILSPTPCIQLSTDPTTISKGYEAFNETRNEFNC